MGSVDGPVLRRAASEGLGTSLLLSTIVGSGIMGSRLSGGDAAITLLVNSLATGLMLSVLILILAPLSGAHLNPAVTVLEVLRRRMPPADLAPYVAGQILGAFAGVLVAHLMFGEQVFQASHHARDRCGGDPARPPGGEAIRHLQGLRLRSRLDRRDARSRRSGRRRRGRVLADLRRRLGPPRRHPVRE